MKSLIVILMTAFAFPAHAIGLSVYEFPVPKGSHPHDVAPAADGGVWYTAQSLGALGHLDPRTGKTRHVPLGEGSSPHGVIVGPDGAPWVTDSGQNAIVRVEPKTSAVRIFPLTVKAYANLNTATFDRDGRLWFTGQSGYYGRLDPKTGKMEVFDAPRGRGPYGIAAASDGTVWYASLAGSYVGRIDPSTGRATVVEPPTSGQGARRVWADAESRVWVSEWNAGQVAVFDPKKDRWKEWRLPGNRPQTYAVYVDEGGMVWLSDFGGDAILRFDPAAETFVTYHLPTPGAQVRQILGRLGQIWLPESANDKLAVICDPCPFR
jgi:virginiamycin B lyase